MMNNANLPLIAEFLKDEQLDNNLDMLLELYVVSYPDKLPELLAKTSTLATKALEQKNKKLRSWDLSTENFIHYVNQTMNEPMSDEQTVLHLANVMQNHFPKGTCDGHSAGEQRFYQKFVKALQNEAQLIDDGWAERRGCQNYLKKVLELNKKNTLT